MAEPSHTTQPKIQTYNLASGEISDLERDYHRNYDSLITQVAKEYEYSWKYMEPRVAEWRNRLKVMNNQKRDKSAVGDPLLFTTFQTVLASLYEDTLGVEWLAREEGDASIAENLNIASNYDYDVMHKNISDYIWDWDTLFYGRGLVYMREFDRDKLVSVPENIDRMSFIRDPKATSVNGDPFRRRGACRFWGRYIGVTRAEMESDKRFFNVNKVKDDVELNNLRKENEQARAEAQGFAYQHYGELNIGDNCEYTLLEWNTHYTVDGRVKKVKFHLANGGTLPVRFEVLGDATDLWPIYERPLYPNAMDFDGVSIPDLVEDKQRARAVMQNLAIQGAKNKVYASYVYDENKVKNKADLMTTEINKHIAVNGSPVDAILPQQKHDVDHQLVAYILNFLDASAQTATATPDIQRGNVSSQQRTLGELNLIASKVENRYSLSQKIFGWSERDFWLRGWYGGLKEHMQNEIDEKIVRVRGPYGDQWRKLDRKSLIAEVDPDVDIESKAVAEMKKARQAQDFGKFATVVLNSDPNANKRYILKKLGKLNNVSSDELKIMLPPTLAELVAEDENLKLSAGKRVDVNPDDDDAAHLEVHMRATPTPETIAHIMVHKMSMAQKAANPQPPTPGAPAPGAPAGGPPPVNPAIYGDFAQNPSNQSGASVNGMSV